MKAAVQLNAEYLAASQHFRHCCTESADTAALDYKRFFERLQKMSSLQQTMSIFHDHLQNRFLHNVKCWNDLRIAMSDGQHSLMQRFKFEPPTVSNQKTKNAANATHGANGTYGDNFFMDTMSSAFNHLAEMNQDTLVSEVERELDEATPHKASSSKNTRSHHVDVKA